MADVYLSTPEGDPIRPYVPPTGGTNTAYPFTGTRTGGAGYTPPIIMDAPAADPTTQDVQSAAEGVGDIEAPDTIDFLGERFRIADNVSLMPLLAFANASKRGLDTDDMEGLAAMYALIRSVVHRPPLIGDDGKRQRDDATGHLLRDESEWQRFETLAMDECADGEDIMEAVNQALAVISARPPKRRGTSSATSPRTSERSRASSSSPGTRPGPDGMTPVAELGR